MRILVLLGLCLNFISTNLAFATATQNFDYRTDSFLLRISVNGGSLTRPDIELVREVRMGLPFVLGFADSFRSQDKYYHIFFSKWVNHSRCHVKIKTDEEVLLNETETDSSISYVLRNIFKTFFGIEPEPVEIFEGYFLEVPISYTEDELKKMEEYWHSYWYREYNSRNDYTIKVHGGISQNLFWKHKSEGKYRYRFGLFVSKEEAEKFKDEISTEDVTLTMHKVRFKCEEFGSIFWPELIPLQKNDSEIKDIVE
jgi:hypothetical protein